MKRLQVEDFLIAAENIPILDVRSPREYEIGRLPSAVSFPLFSNEERSVIGTLYKQEGRNVAIKKGLEIVGPKLLNFIEKAESFKSETLALHCWRGGMRSESMAWLLERYGLRTLVLEGGYKAYRNHLLIFFNSPLPLKVISGYTGSKKTILLHLLKEKGEQVIDLEGLAGHQGSSFGNAKCVQQPTTENFQNLVYHEFRKLDLSRPIWIEDESIRIGQVDVIEGLYKRMSESPHVFIEIDRSQRVDFLVEDYGMLSPEQLTEATQRIKKKLGNEKTSEAIRFIQAGELRKAAEIIITYYDTWYEKAIAKKKHLIHDHYKIDISELPALASKLITKTYAV